MVSSKAKTVEEYLSSLPEERRNALSAVRKVILDNLPKGYVETMQYGMISYIIPLDEYPDTYNGQALTIASLASQKNYMSVYLLGIYSSSDKENWFVKEYAASGKKLDMGKSCVRFRKAEDLPLPLIGKVIAKVPPKDFIARYEKSRKKK